MNTRILTLLLLGVVAVPSHADRKSRPFLCDNVYKILSPAAVERIARDDRNRREDEIMRTLGPEGMATVEKALGVSPFHKVQTLEEALRLHERVTSDATVYEPINGLLQKMSGPRRWAFYLVTAFHALPTHSEGHRSMVQQTAEHLPKAAVAGGSYPRLLDVGIGNGNMLAANMAANPKASLLGLDVAGGSLSRSMGVMNSVVDELQQAHEGPKMFDYGRFGLVRGSASDPTLLNGQKFDGASMILTLFAVPEAERQQALRITADHLVPGGSFVLIDPVPQAGSGSNGKNFITDVIRSAFENNEDLTALDVSVLTAMNMHSLLKTHFLTPEEQRAMGVNAGLIPNGPSKPVYYGIANMQKFEKPWHSGEKAPFVEASPERATELEAAHALQARVEDELRRRVPEPISVRMAKNSDAREVQDFINRERGKLGVVISPELERDFNNLEQNFQGKGGFLSVLRNKRGEVIGTFALVPTAPGEGEICKLYLAEEYRKSGLGENIVDELVHYAAHTGIQQLSAETTPRLQSLQLFERAGFSIVPKPARAKSLTKDEGIWLTKRLPL